ncbi:MAG: hypothetical protein ABI809_11560 [Caldimonas sp.]
MKRQRAWYGTLALAFVLSIVGCGGGGSADVGVVVVGGGISVARLDVVLSRPGPLTIQIDWSDDPAVYSYTVTRDGATLAAGLASSVLIDASVIFNVQYCYQVFGYDRSGQVISATEVACVIV